jgi:hypothetical protein
MRVVERVNAGFGFVSLLQAPASTHSDTSAIKKILLGINIT